MAASLTTALRKCARGAAALCSAALLTIATAGAASAQGLIRDAEIEETLRVYTDPLLVAAGLERNSGTVLDRAIFDVGQTRDWRVADVYRALVEG